MLNSTFTLHTHKQHNNRNNVVISNIHQDSNVLTSISFATYIYLQWANDDKCIDAKNKITVNRLIVTFEIILKMKIQMTKIILSFLKPFIRC